MTGVTPSTKADEFRNGWKLVLTAFLGLAMGTTGIFLYSQGLFIRPLQTAFGWSRGEAAIMPLVFGLTLAVSYPIMGLLVDRFGCRAVAMVSALCLSVGFFALSQMNGSIAIFIIIILFIAFCGSGTAVPHARLVGSGFDKARGIALGITMTGTGLAAIIVPPLLGIYLQDHGWRAAYRVLALAALVPLPLVALFANDPRSAGRRQTAGTPPTAQQGMSLADALRSRRFWLMGFGFTCAGAATAGLVPHYIPMMQDFGMTPAKAGAMFAVMGMAVVGGRLLTGVLCDYFFAPYVAASILTLSALGCIGMIVFGMPFAIMMALLVGLGLGAEIDLAGYMSARYFGLGAYGSILGFQYGMYGAGSGLGAILFGILFDRFGNYQAALAAAAASLFIGIICALLLGPYPRHERA